MEKEFSNKSENKSDNKDSPGYLSMIHNLEP